MPLRPSPPGFLLTRRLGLGLALGFALPAQAQIADLAEAINLAGRQRMLSQRLSKAWLARAQPNAHPQALPVLQRSIEQFERQLNDLQGYAPNAAIRQTYADLDSAWNAFRQQLQEAPAARPAAQALLQADARVLTLAHQGTQQLEALATRPTGRWVNVAGRQRMLSQRMAKFYFAAAWQLEVASAREEIKLARQEFLSAASALRQAPETSPRIADELALAEGQWVFFDAALKAEGNSPKQLHEVFVSSENLLAVMDRVTRLYAAQKA